MIPTKADGYIGERWEVIVRDDDGERVGDSIPVFFKLKHAREWINQSKKWLYEHRYTVDLEHIKK